MKRDSTILRHIETAQEVEINGVQATREDRQTLRQDLESGKTGLRQWYDGYPEKVKVYTY